MSDTEDSLPIVSVSARTSQPQIAAGAPFDLTIRLMPEEGADLGGLIVDVLNADGAPLECAEVTGLTPDRRDAGGVMIEAADGSFATGPIKMVAPDAPGPFEMRLSVREAETPPEAGEHFAVTLNVDAHVVGLSVWDVPRAVQPGKPFAFKVGLSCADGCDTTGWTAEVRDGAGAVIAEAVMGSETWKTTEHLHFAEMQATAPEALGRHDWDVQARPAETAGLPHGETHAALRLQVTPEPEFRIRIEALDQLTGAPLKGAKIVADPYRAVADENGVAELFVHRGAYRLFVSGPSHIARRFDAEVAQDLALRAALVRDEGFTDADLW